MHNKRVNNSICCLLFFGLFLVQGALLHAQSASITLDGLFDDWTAEISTVTDTPESIDGLDILEMQVTNDEHYLFIKIVTNSEFDLTDDLFAQRIRLYIDSDDNPSTGFDIQENYGAELAVFFKNHYAHFNVEPYSQLTFSDFGFRVSPTVSSDTFEMAIRRDLLPDGLNPLFTSSSIRILILNDLNDDRLPNEGQTFSYTFDDSPVDPYEPIDLEKENENHIRTVFYNTLGNGLINQTRVAYFENVVKVLHPDIIAFSECGSTSSTTVKSLLDDWIPLENSEGWYVDKLSGSDVITGSRWPIIQSWSNLTRQFPTLIDLPSSYPKNLLVTNAHLSCCGADDNRQEQVDEYIAFILDATTSGGIIDLTDGTPFIYGGDLNLVGFAQQLTTLKNGDIQNTAAYGMGELPDWDDSEVTDIIPLHTDQRMDYTWRDDGNDYPPGRLDFTLYSDAVMTVEKAFVLETETMSQDRLFQYGLNPFDTGSASDHFPVVTDFSFNDPAAVQELAISDIYLYPNPTSKSLTINLENINASNSYIVIYNAIGKEILKIQNTAKNQVVIDTESWVKGTYIFQIISEKGLHKSGKLIVQ